MDFYYCSSQKFILYKYVQVHLYRYTYIQT